MEIKARSGENACFKKGNDLSFFNEPCLYLIPTKEVWGSKVLDTPVDVVLVFVKHLPI